MGNTRYRLRLAADVILDVRDALLDKYGAYHAVDNPTGVTIHYAESTYLIFSCTAIADKVIRLRFNSDTWYSWYGSAYTSGSNINDAVEVGTGPGTTQEHYLILGDNHFALASISSTIGGAFIYIGKLSNSDYVISHLMLGSSTYAAYGRSFNTTAGEAAQPMTYGCPVGSYRTEDCKYVRFPVSFRVTSTGVAYLNGDNTLATAPDWYTVSVDTGQSGVLVLPNGILTGSMSHQTGPFRVSYYDFWVEYDEVA